MEKSKNIVVRFFQTFIYSSYTFHLAVVGLSYLGYIFSKNMDIKAPYPLVSMIIMSVLSFAVIGTMTQINYKEIKQNLNHKIISILTYKNKISEGERTINTLLSSTFIISVLNILNYILIFQDKIRPLWLIVLFVYIVLVFAQINALHRTAKKIRLKK